MPRTGHPPAPDGPTRTDGDDLTSPDLMSTLRALAGFGGEDASRPASDDTFEDDGEGLPLPGHDGPDSVEPPVPAERGHAPPEGLAACLLDVGVGVIEIDAGGRVRHMNAVAERLTGWPFEEKRGAPVDQVFRVVGLATPATDDPVRYLELGSDSGMDSTALLERRDGHILAVRHVLGIAPREGSLVRARLPGFLIVFREANVDSYQKRELERRARYDPLTGMLTRHALAEHVERALEHSRRDGLRHSLCWFDIGAYRLVNATCGHDAGDELLEWAATRVHEIVGPDDAVCRIGGEEFALLLYGRELPDAEARVRRLQGKLLEFRFGWGDKTFTVETSLGLVGFGAEMERASDVISAASHAWQQAKKLGHGRLHVYVPEDSETARARRAMQWVAALQRHLADGRLRLYAQAIQPLPPHRTAGAHFEVLARVIGEDGRIEGPVDVIQAAEQSGLMDSIDRFVIRQALRMIGSLPREAMRRLETCAINLSAISFLREGLFDFIVAELHRNRLPPGKICFEITETAALANLDEVVWFIRELSGTGCRFAIDDFGSGHASYGYLERLPVDYVKIDGVFIRDIEKSAVHRSIVESVVRVANTLGIKTVAEWVENDSTAELLSAMGVQYAQGWRFGKPQPLVDVCAALVK